MHTRTFSRRLAGTLVAAVAALPLLTAQSAAAHPLAPGTGRPVPEPTVRPGLLLTVSDARHTLVRGVRLLCEPVPHGRHPRAAEACAALDRAGGDPAALRAAPGFCTLRYAPVTVTAEGTHRGKHVSWRETYPNACAMQRATGPLFAF
ncbi:SSI family serine proteinase inhibitor [Streptomyces albus]|uniref:SSI family serine proteinase inhibitor n=1 Tax=Streptomyces albus TaxID=1888 RepID=UPI0024AE2497|nr:SSI family serine proteinase inhibitor [Streptomyces albus]MDI6407300.1 SSI family serine proteinase inhibitor [Streptomyces albus]